MPVVGETGAFGPLLDADEPPPMLEIGRERSSAFVIAVDHASARIPRRLGRLGLPLAELERHIAWDIGALEVARRIAADLDAPLIATSYSRLVIDCNRDPRVASSIPTVAETIEIPGNIGLSDEEVVARREQIFQPYHARLRELLDARERSGQPTILATQHTMTDVFKGIRRAMHAAVLYNRDRRFASLVLEALRSERGLVVGDNEPYFVSDETDYTIPQHGEARGLLHVEIEIRQDLVGHKAGQAEWAVRIARALRFAQHKLTAARR